MSDTLISVENLSKKYRIKHQREPQRYTALRDVIAHKFAAPFQGLFGRNGSGNAGGSAAFSASRLKPRPLTSDLRPLFLRLQRRKTFWALKDVCIRS